MRDGKTQVVDAPAPGPTTGALLVANAASAISSGTERSLVARGSGSLAARAIRNSDLVRQTLKHARDVGCDLVLPRSKFVEDLPTEMPKWFATT